jgi:anti-sigma regulatory factor (Ser/Thr protein kinase)
VLALQYCGQPGGVELKEMTVTIANDLEELGKVVAEFDKFAEAHGLADRLRRSMSLVFDELLNNTISYAYPDGGEHSIEIKIAIIGDKLEVTVLDDGVPFNPFAQTAPDTSLAMEDRDIGGLGIHLVNKVMDETHYTRRTSMNVVTLIKRLEAL